MAQLMAFLVNVFVSGAKVQLLVKYSAHQSQLLINVSQVFCILTDFLSRIS